MARAHRELRDQLAQQRADMLLNQRTLVTNLLTKSRIFHTWRLNNVLKKQKELLEGMPASGGYDQLRILFLAWRSQVHLGQRNKNKSLFHHTSY